MHAACTKDSDCCGGLTCVNKACHDKDGDNCIALNENCDVGGTQCCGGLKCHEQKCKGCLITGFFCSPEEQNCCDGNLCNPINKKCQICPSSTDVPYDCTTTADCELGGCKGYRCINSVCSANNCLGFNKNGCSSSGGGECCEGLWCRSNTCVVCAASDQKCTESTECCDGYWCEGGKCKSCCGTACTDDATCTKYCSSSNLKCIDGTCQPPQD